MQPHAQVAAVRRQARRARRPTRRRDEHARRRQALGGGELTDGAGDALAQRVIVGAQYDHACAIALSRLISCLCLSPCAEPGVPLIGREARLNPWLWDARLPARCPVPLRQYTTAAPSPPRISAPSTRR